MGTHQSVSGSRCKIGAHEVAYLEAGSGDVLTATVRQVLDA